MIGKEKILFSLKQNKKLAEEVILFGMSISNQPRVIVEAGLSAYLNHERDKLLKENEGKRSMTGLKFLWDAEPIAAHHAGMSSEPIRLVEKSEPIKKPLLTKNVKTCPACSSDDTYLYEKRENNGIIGPGFSSWVIESYWICDDCGIHFTPKTK